jgi:tetratricopeptide (TPR) repeat protein
MKPKKYSNWIIVFLAAFSFGFVIPVEAAEERCDPWVARAESVQGTVEVRKAGQTMWELVKLYDTFCTGDMIRVQENSRAAIVMGNETNLALDQRTTLTFTGIEQEKSFFMELVSGAVHFFSRFPKSLKILTPFVNASVEGTEGLIRVEFDKSLLTIFEGKVLASNAAGSLTLTSGKSAIAEAGKAPVLRVVVRPRDAVHWVLYYPPVIYVPPAEAPKEDPSDPRFLAYRASRLLTVGRVDDAGADIERSLRLDPNYSDAFALQSIIAVVQNDKQKAHGSAQKAIEADPTSATARIAMSYALQASFDLEGARANVQEAVKLDSQNALAWARLAELWSSFGNLDKALEVAKKAVGLDPNLSRTQMVLGFAYLTQVKTQMSKTAFEKAIELDQADPLSRLGLGLAKIREGDLRAGGREIEIAASLDPNNALVRSYLGKTYFEEKRTDLDGREYAIAKELDPNDPTPYYYDAIRKQSINQPVAALHDLQKSIELNGNRAVYRSRLQLDQDLAARSASLGRIYNNLGFQQLGLVEGWKSVNTAPANYSAHRFLADTYAVLPRHEIARVSELLQSQLLQPINITPVQPQLAEANLSILDGAGPQDLSFNEFNPLFIRNRFALQANGVLGENDTWGNDLIQNTVWGKLSYSIGQFHYETDGFRKNNDQEQNVINVFAQLSITPNTSLQAEYRYTDTENGDLPLRFDQNLFFPTERQDDDSNSIRLGFRHAFTPQSNLIASFIYRDANFETVDKDPFFGFELSTDEDGYLGEVQHLYQFNRFHLTSGLGYFDADRKDEFSFSPVPENSDIDHTNLYMYSLIHYPQNLTWTLGWSADFLDGAVKDRDQFNPKIGLSWNPFPKTSLRAAVFRTLKRTLISSQTIEPTQVAGFNQFFDDDEATDAWRYGVGVDQRFSGVFFGGAEFSKRDLDVPYTDFFSGNVEEVDWDEYLGRAYLFWTPHDWLTLSAEYQYERLKRDKDNVGPELFTKLETHRLPLGIKFFHPTGIDAGLKATYIDQRGTFGDPLDTLERGDDQFWTVDAMIGYRLPKRWGLLSLEARNLLDEEFKFQDTDPANPRITPERFILGKITLSF